MRFQFCVGGAGALVMEKHLRGVCMVLVDEPDGEGDEAGAGEIREKAFHELRFVPAHKALVLALIGALLAVVTHPLDYF